MKILSFQKQQPELKTLLNVVGNVISNESGLKIKLKVSTVDIQIKQSALN